MAEQNYDLDALDDELMALDGDAMVLQSFDGYVAGLLVCPDIVPSPEWLPPVWSIGGDDPGPASVASYDRLRPLLMGHYHRVGATLLLDPKSYFPLFPFDEAVGDLVWQIWAEGFARAMALRPAAFRRFADADAATVDAFAKLCDLLDAADRAPAIPRAKRPRVSTSGLEERLAGWIATLFDWRIKRGASLDFDMPPPPPERAPKLGRNDKCPCGSGLKYERCHGAS